MTVSPIILRRLRAQAAIFSVRNARRRARRPKRPPRFRYPLGIERAYFAVVKAQIDGIREAYAQTLGPRLEGLARQAQQLRPASGGDARADGWPEAAAQLITQIRISVAATTPSETEIAGLAAEVSTWNKTEWRKQMVAVLGFDLVQAEPWLLDDLKGWAKENAALITSLEEDGIAQIERITLRGLRQGDRYEDIAEAIQERLDVTESKAALLARDQVSKLNGALTKHRQTAVGVEEYTWRTTGDDRVRPSHREHNGKKFRWDDPPAETGHPGEDYNCRCNAEPDFTGLLEGLADLEEEGAE